MRKATEPDRTYIERSEVSAALKRLAVAAELEQKARREVDLLMRRTVELGVTDYTLAAAMGISKDAARMRRRRFQKGTRDPGRRCGYMKEAA